MTKLSYCKISSCRNDEYYEIHYYLPNNDDTQFCELYRGKLMRSYSTALKCVDYIKKQYPNAFYFDIALYDDSGRID